MTQTLTPDMLAWGYTIADPGTYFLAGRTWLLGEDGIRIESSGVTLDLKGYTITANPQTKACISLKRGATRVRIQDGAVQGDMHLRADARMVAPAHFCMLARRPKPSRRAEATQRLLP